MSEMAASLAISGSICLPTGVDLSTLKFCRSVRQYWLALMAVTSRSYLNWSGDTFRRLFVRPYDYIINSIININNYPTH